MTVHEVSKYIIVLISEETSQEYVLSRNSVLGKPQKWLYHYGAMNDYNYMRFDSAMVAVQHMNALPKQEKARLEVRPYIF